MQMVQKAEIQYKMLEILPPVDSIEWYENATLEEVKELVDELYTIVLNVDEVDAVPVRNGKWIIGRHEFGTSWHCSMCDFIVDVKHRYCNNCGARMVNG